MRKPITTDQLAKEVERRLGQACYVEIIVNPEIEWTANVSSNMLRAQQLQDQIDPIVRELQTLYVLVIARTLARELVRNLLKHPAAVVNILGTSPGNYQVQVLNAGPETQKSAEQIFARLNSMYQIE